MGICLIVIRNIQRSCDIDIVCVVHVIPHHMEQFFIVRGEVSMFLRKKVAFIRDNGEINIHLLVSQIFLIDICKPVRRMFQRIHLKRIFKLCCVTILYINIMIIKLTKRIVGGIGFQRPELIPQRKLIKSILFKSRHKASVGHGIQGKLRALCKLSPFTVRKLLGRQQPGRHGKTNKYDAQHNHGNDVVHIIYMIDIFCIVCILYAFYILIFYHLSFLPNPRISKT